MPYDAASQTILPATNKDRLKAALVMAAVACAGIATLTAGPTRESAHDQARISDACSPVGPYQGSYQQKGVDTSLASNLLLLKPAQTQQICAAVNGALSVAHTTSRRVDNAPLQALAESLGINPGEASTLAVAHMLGETHLKTDTHAPQLKKASQEVPADSAPSMEPNM